MIVTTDESEVLEDDKGPDRAHGSLLDIADNTEEIRASRLDEKRERRGEERRKIGVMVW